MFPGEQREKGDGDGGGSGGEKGLAGEAGAALWQRAYDTTGAAGADDDRDVWGIGGAYRMGAATLKAQYYSAGELGGVADSGADMWAIGADYSLSKRTTVYATYAQTSNDSAAAFSVSGGGHGDNMGSVMGETTSGVQMGVAHSF